MITLSEENYIKAILTLSLKSLEKVSTNFFVPIHLLNIMQQYEGL